MAPMPAVRIYELNPPHSALQGDILSATFSDLLDPDGAIQSTTYQWQSSSDNGLSWTDLSGETNQQLDTSAQSLVGQTFASPPPPPMPPAAPPPSPQQYKPSPMSMTQPPAP